MNLMKISVRQFSKLRFLSPTVLLLLVIFGRLIVASVEFGNVWGCVISMLHASVVAVGTLWCLVETTETVTTK